MVKISKDALRSAMIAAGKGVLQLAYDSKLHDATICRLLKLGGNAHYATAYHLAAALNCSPFDLIDDSDAPRRKVVN